MSIHTPTQLPSTLIYIYMSMSMFTSFTGVEIMGVSNSLTYMYIRKYAMLLGRYLRQQVSLQPKDPREYDETANKASSATEKEIYIVLAFHHK
jgi:hypothetical protein